MTITEEDIQAALGTICRVIEGGGERMDDGFAVDFNSGILGSPYLVSSSLFRNRDIAQAFANLVVDFISELAEIALKVIPEWGGEWTEPEFETAAYCYLDEYKGGDIVDDDMEIYYGPDGGGFYPLLELTPEEINEWTRARESMKSAIASVKEDA